MDSIFSRLQSARQQILSARKRLSASLNTSAGGAEGHYGPRTPVSSPLDKPDVTGHVYTEMEAQCTLPVHTENMYVPGYTGTMDPSFDPDYKDPDFYADPEPFVSEEPENETRSEKHYSSTPQMHWDGIMPQEVLPNTEYKPTSPNAPTTPHMAWDPTWHNTTEELPGSVNLEESGSSNHSDSGNGRLIYEAENKDSNINDERQEANEPMAWDGIMPSESLPGTTMDGPSDTNDHPVPQAPPMGWDGNLQADPNPISLYGPNVPNNISSPVMGLDPNSLDNRYIADSGNYRPGSEGSGGVEADSGTYGPASSGSGTYGPASSGSSGGGADSGSSGSGSGGSSSSHQMGWDPTEYDNRESLESATSGSGSGGADSGTSRSASSEIIYQDSEPFVAEIGADEHTSSSTDTTLNETAEG